MHAECALRAAYDLAATRRDQAAAAAARYGRALAEHRQAVANPGWFDERVLSDRDPDVVAARELLGAAHAETRAPAGPR